MNYDKITKESREAFWEIIDKAKNISITSHMSPDDDSISSVLSLYAVIKKLYPDKSLRIIYPGVPENRYKSFKLFEKIEWLPDISTELDSIDLLILLDANQYGRVSREPLKFLSLKNIICVDHHSSPPDKFVLSIIDSNSPCNAQILYELCESLEINKELAEIFLLGILGDTGNFAYLKPSQTKTLLIAKKLIEIGNIEIQEFQSRYRGISENVFEIIQELIKNLKHGEIKGYKLFSYSYLDRKYVENKKFTDLDMTAAKNVFVSSYIRTIENHPWGFVVIPKADQVSSVSFRSLPQGENVRIIAEKMQIGGGHDLASGGTIKDEPDSFKALNWLLNWLKTH